MGLRFKVAPLSGTFMITSMFGFLTSVLYLSQIQGAESYAFAFGFLFILMFIASVISMTYAPVEAELKIDEPREIRKLRKTKISTSSEHKRQGIKKALKNNKHIIKIKSKK